jgi:hypothetical protein
VFDTQETHCLEFKELMCGFSILCKGTLDEKLKRKLFALLFFSSPQGNLQSYFHSLPNLSSQ